MQLGPIVRRVWGDVRPPRPPVCPPGWVVAPPDFVGIGVQRSGTTWWHELVVAHPGVHAGGPKELQFLRRYWQRPFGATDAEEYHRFFARPPGQLAGEWSPGYLSHFWVPPVLRVAAPDARLLVVLRDPVDRYVSGFALQGETRRARASAASTAFRLGCYATHFDQLFASFTREQVLVLQYERCVRSPQEELARTYRFLGLDEEFVPAGLAAVRNANRGRKQVLPPDVERALVSAYTHEVVRLRDELPQLDLSLWSNFQHLA